MDWRKLLSLSVIGWSLAVGSVSAGPVVPCPDAVRRTTGCPELVGSVGRDSVTLGAQGMARHNGSGGNGSPGRGGGDVAPDPGAWNEEQARANGNYRGVYDVVSPATPPRVVTLNDIANFAPAVGGNHMEPNGWIVVGLDTNFYSDAGARVVEGSLLGQPADRRRNRNWCRARPRSSRWAP